MKVGPKEVTQTLNVNADRLREWDGWKSKSKEYLKSIGKYVNLEKVVDDYDQRADSLYLWFHQQQEIIHKKDLDELAYLEEKWLRIQEENQAALEKLLNDKES